MSVTLTTKPGTEVRSIISEQQQTGAVFIEHAGWQTPAHFGDAATEYRSARRNASLFDLSARGKIELAGPDALKFLHNLCTQEVKNLPVGAGCEAFLTNAKARVIAPILVGHFHHLDQDRLLLDGEPGLATKILQHLNRHLISEQVELADRTREFALVHLCGPNAQIILEKVGGGTLPDLPMLHHVTRSVGNVLCHVRRHQPLALPGYDLFCDSLNGAEVWRTLIAGGASPAGSEVYEILRVEAGTPVFGQDIDEDRFAVEVGRSEQAICFTKGCFLGQEPIVMARDRGHVNRLLVGIKISKGGSVANGTRLFRDESEVGQVTSSVFSPQLQQTIALAYVRRGSWEPGTVLQMEPLSEGRQGVVAKLPLADLVLDAK